MRNYRYRPRRKIVIRRRLIALLTAVTLGVGGYAIYRHFNGKAIVKAGAEDGLILYDTNGDIYGDEEIAQVQEAVEEIETVEEDQEPVQEEVITEVVSEPVQEVQLPYDPNFNKGDTVISIAEINLRLNTNTDSYRFGKLPQGAIVNRIFTIDGWDLVNYQGQLCFVSTDYTRDYEADYNYEYYYTEEYNDIVRTTSKLYCRMGPSTDERDLFLLDKNEELVVIAKAVLYSDPSDVWYIVRARGQIGFVSAKYTKSLKQMISNSNTDITDVEVKKIGYLTRDTTIYDSNGLENGYAEQYQTFQVLAEKDGYYFVNLDGQIGYINKKNANIVKGAFIVVDISSQRVYYYCDTDIAFMGRCTTGAKRTPTTLGVFNPYFVGSSHDFGNNHKAEILWAQLNSDEQGFHDAPWEKEEKFGDPEYTRNHGSLGCIRLPDAVARFIKSILSKKTTVIVKK